MLFTYATHQLANHRVEKECINGLAARESIGHVLDRSTVGVD